jgi:hypothetical protein
MGIHLEAVRQLSRGRFAKLVFLVLVAGGAALIGVALIGAGRTNPVAPPSSAAAPQADPVATAAHSNAEQLRQFIRDSLGDSNRGVIPRTRPLQSANGHYTLTFALDRHSGGDAPIWARLDVVKVLRAFKNFSPAGLTRLTVVATTSDGRREIPAITLAYSRRGIASVTNRVEAYCDIFRQADLEFHALPEFRAPPPGC